MVRAKSIKAAEKAKRVQIALDGLADGTYVTVRQAVDALKVSKTTLRRHLNGGQTREQAHEKDQLLTRQEEKALAKWISGATAAGNPVDRHCIMEMAQGMREARTPLSEGFLRPIGNDWIKRFLRRHPHLCSTLSRSIERARISDVTADQIRKFNEEFRRVHQSGNFIASWPTWQTLCHVTNPCHVSNSCHVTPSPRHGNCVILHLPHPYIHLLTPTHPAPRHGQRTSVDRFLEGLEADLPEGDLSPTAMSSI